MDVELEVRLDLVFYENHLFLALCSAQRESGNGSSMSANNIFCAGNATVYFSPHVLRSEKTLAALHVGKSYILRRMVNACAAVIGRCEAVVHF